MSKKEVEIVYSSKGLREILIDGEEMDCDAIKEKIIPAWFEPARDKSGWKGLIPEIQDFLADDSVELAFSFNGPDEFKKMFDRALKENSIETAKLSNQEISSARVESAQKAALTGNYSDAVKNLLVAAQLGRADAMRRLAICFRDGTGTDVDLDAYNDWLRKAAQAGDAEALDMLVNPTTTQAAVEKPAEPLVNIEKCFDDALNSLDQDKDVSALRELAEKGYAPAQNNLGLAFIYGVGVAQDASVGVEWIQKAVEQGDADAIDSLGDCYYYGYGVDEDEKRAFDLYSQAAEQGVVESQNSLGRCYYNGAGVEENKEKAFLWFKKAAEQEYPDAQNMLGICYFKGNGITENDKLAFRWVEKAAKQGLALAQSNLGFFYLNGIGTDEDAKKAFEWYKKSAEQGYADAQNELGDCYCFGIGVKENKDKAFEWYQKAAEQENTEAQNMLGRCFQEGWGVEQDEAVAFDWYEKAADQGLAVAQNNLAYCYDNGFGVKKDETAAFEWYQKAAEQGNAPAQTSVGVDYAVGCGVKKNLDEAGTWLKRAVEQDDAAACYWLAEVIYAKNVKDDLNYEDKSLWGKVYGAVANKIGEKGATVASWAVGGLAGWFAAPVALSAAAIGAGSYLIKSGEEKKKAKLFLQTKAGKEMLRLYECAADSGMDIAQTKLNELQKYM